MPHIETCAHSQNSEPVLLTGNKNADRQVYLHFIRHDVAFLETLIASGDSARISTAAASLRCHVAGLERLA